jgi:hypothetical protein
MLSTVTKRVLRIRIVPQIGVITNSPVRKYRFREERSEFMGNGPFL